MIDWDAAIDEHAPPALAVPVAVVGPIEVDPVVTSPVLNDVGTLNGSDATSVPPLFVWTFVYAPLCA